jgi:antitoxin CcdA
MERVAPVGIILVEHRIFVQSALRGDSMATFTESTTYDRDAPRRAVNLSLNEDLVSRVNGLTQDLSGTVEELLAAYVRSEQARGRAEDDRLEDVISALNARHERDGFLSDEFSSL